MTSLLEFKQYIQRFYIKNETYITYVWKFLLALVSILLINNRLGYMHSLSNIAIVMMASLLCAIMPPNFIMFVAAVFIVGHLYFLAIECALVTVVVFLLMFLLYFRFSPKDTLAVLLTPVFFFLRIPYVMPLAMGLLGTPASIISVSFGLVISYMLSYFSANAANFGSIEGVEQAPGEFTNIISGMLGDKTMIVMIAAFAVALIITYFIRRSSLDHCWKIAIAAGSISMVLVLLVGGLMSETNISVVGVILGTIVSALLALVIEFFAFNLDYSRTEKVQFEDDEYYYYVKAVPKVTLATPERRVKKINRAHGKR